MNHWFAHRPFVPESSLRDGIVVASVHTSNKVSGVALDINLGYTRRNGDGTIAPRHVVDNILLRSRNRGIGWAAELFGHPGTSGPSGKSPTVAVLFGPTLALTSWLVFDLGLIQPLAGPQPHAVYFGVVSNIGRMWG